MVDDVPARTGNYGPEVPPPVPPPSTALASGIVQATKLSSNTVVFSGANADKWRVITGADFAYQGSARFALTAEGAVLTYVSGPDAAVFYFGAQLTVDEVGGVPSLGVAAVMSKNTEFVDVTPAATDAAVAAGASFGAIDAATDSVQCFTKRRFVLNVGDSVRVVSAVFTAATPPDHFLVDSMTLYFQEVLDG